MRKPTKGLARQRYQRGMDDRRARVTFAAFAERWMKEVLVHQKRSSQSSVRSHVRAHLIPAFGAMHMDDICMEAIQQFVTGSSNSPKTVRNVVVTLMSMWSTAQAWGYAQHNPFPRGASGRLLLALPAPRAAQTYHFSVEEALAIIDKAQGRWKTFFRILAETGMRPGECAGLRRDAIGEGNLSISQSVWGQKVQTPKSKAGVRTIAISAALAADIRELVDATPENEYGLVFVTDKGRGERNTGGKPLSMDNFRNRVLNPILEELGIDKKLERLGIARCGFYPMRHMNLTLMDSLNTPMKTRQKRAGHAQIETTLKHYTHAIDADDRVAADRIGALLSPKRDYAPDYSPEVIPPGILAHPAVQAEIARQVALILGKQGASIIEAPPSPLLVLSVQRSGRIAGQRPLRGGTSISYASKPSVVSIPRVLSGAEAWRRRGRKPKPR